ncbi:MAG: lysine exporter LysO family protein [Oscillospiraceae bacterium]|nr:lysine exporter LysO family protein [Oscillospiraceae bacterium]
MSAAQGTLLNLLIYVALVAVGALLGSRLPLGERAARWLSRLQFLSLMILIVTLGLKLGSDDQVIASLGQIGLAALLITVLTMVGSLLAVTLLRRFVLKLDRFGRGAGADAQERTENAHGGKADNALTKWIVTAVVVGMAAGYFLLPDNAAGWCGRVIDFGLYLLLFLVGMDMGRQGTVLRDVKAAGFRVLLVPVAVLVGTLLAALVASLALPLSAKDTVAASAGLGWYSLAPTLLAPYSLSVSAVAFLSNVMREIFSIVAIPFVARYVGYLECVSLPGAAAMDTVLPVVVGATHERITIYSFASGVILSLLVPILVPLIIALPL